MNSFLENLRHFHARANAGQDVHISEDEIAEFQRLAKSIDPNKDFNGVQGCQSCVNNLVKFVFDKEKTLLKNESFPAQKPADDGQTEE